MYTDSHCHLYKEYYDDINKVINDAAKEGVKKLITCGCDYKTNLEVIDVVKRYPNVYGAIGVHPTEISKVNETLKLIEDNIDISKIIAIGEIGLDYHYEGFNKEEQIAVFEATLNLAEKYHKPVIIHSRDADEDTYNILKKHHVKGVIHSFSSDLEMAKKYIALGFLIGINGTITFKNSSLLEIVKQIPLTNILIETDSPYLTPVPFRGQKNEPKMVLEVAKFLSANLEINPLKLAEILEQNLNQIFDI